MIFDTVNYTTSKIVRIKKNAFKKKIAFEIYFFFNSFLTVPTSVKFIVEPKSVTL